jgi:UDP-N-acetylglucosamine diphosphorylase/glucosamine-1-phosphate N-acetyltransferase
MRLCLVEDDAVADLEPLTLTRPAFDLRLGCQTLGARIGRAFGIAPRAGDRGAILRSSLASSLGRDGLAVNDRRWLAAGHVLVAKSRWVPPPGFAAPDFGTSWVGLCEGEHACAWVGPEHAAGLELNGIDGWFEEVASEARIIDVGGQWVCRPWDLVSRNADHLRRDLASAGTADGDRRDPTELTVVGPAERLFVHRSARVDPYVVFDTTNGPIRVEAGVVVQPFTRIEGPCFIGRDTQLFRANLRGGVTLGPNCRIGGEVEEAIVHGHSNKYHEGFLGHAYVGEWVNLGAITSNSDLRNDYGEVAVPLRGDPIPTGQAKVGCFIGDHTRTGMGSMLNTGTAIGVMCNVLPAGPLLPKHVPSFSAVLYGRVAPGFDLEQMFETARTVKGRRGQVFTPAEEQLYRELYERTRLERERAFQKVNERRGDRWAVAAAYV